MSNDKLKTALDEATRKLEKISMKPDDKSQWPVCVDLNKFQKDAEAQRFEQAFNDKFGKHYQVQVQPVVKNSYIASSLQIEIKPKL